MSVDLERLQVELAEIGGLVEACRANYERDNYSDFTIDLAECFDGHCIVENLQSLIAEVEWLRKQVAKQVDVIREVIIASRNPEYRADGYRVMQVADATIEAAEAVLKEMED